MRYQFGKRKFDPIKDEEVFLFEQEGDLTKVTENEIDEISPDAGTELRIEVAEGKWLSIEASEWCIMKWIDPPPEQPKKPSVIDRIQ